MIYLYIFCSYDTVKPGCTLYTEQEVVKQSTAIRGKFSHSLSKIEVSSEGYTVVTQHCTQQTSKKVSSHQNFFLKSYSNVFIRNSSHLLSIICRLERLPYYPVIKAKMGMSCFFLTDIKYKHIQPVFEAKSILLHKIWSIFSK